MRVETNVAVPMRDGIVLRGDIYRPESATPAPTLLLRTPYDRTHPLIPHSGIDPEAAVEAGFAVVCQDVRGQYGSEGEFTTFVHEGTDGYDSVEWAASQPWSSGAVCMVGRSYAGACQWLAAAEQPPHLVAIAPVVTGSDYYEGWIYQGGAFQLGFNLFWVQLMADPRGANRIDELYRQRPLATVSIPDPKYARIYREWLDHPTDDDYWQTLSINRRYDRVRVPVLNVGGWYDIFLRGTLENFVRMQQEAGSERARRGQRLVIGPWSHGTTFGPYPDHSFDIFGATSAIDLTEAQLRFFTPEDEGEPPVRIFVMGENRWRDADAWPPGTADPKRWFLHGDGSLSPLPPGQEPPDTFAYDPANPAPTVGGPVSLPGPMTRPNTGPLDQRRVEERPDVLVYTSDPLERPLEVVGPLGVTLYAATTGPDTDFVAKLCDVWPDGVSRILAEGIRRASFREGYDRRRLVEPGRVYAYTIDLVATANVFQPGHRARLVITSSSFPRFDPNPNTGGPLGEDYPGDARPARQTIFHDSEHPSHVLLPVVSR